MNNKIYTVSYSEQEHIMEIGLIGRIGGTTCQQ